MKMESLMNRPAPTLVALFAALSFSLACQAKAPPAQDGEKKAEATKTQKVAEAKKAPAQPAPEKKAPPATGPKAPSNPKNPVVIMKTSMGELEIELFADKSPISTENFLGYVKDKAYDGTIFHRVIANFMIQGGGFDKALAKRPTKSPIKNEAQNGLSNKRGTLSMARTGVVDSATNQFFINVVDNARLDHRGPGRQFGYAVFGQVLRGMEVADKIRAMQTGACPPHFQRDCPQTQVVIESVTPKK
jgi:cyclophilin family peptidyl-prolyl cis-trans isomerase